MGSTPPNSSSSGPAPTPPAEKSQPEYKQYPSGPRVLVSAAPGGVRRGAGSLVGGAAFSANAVQGDNFYDTQGTNYQYHALFALSIAFLIVFATQVYVKTGSGTTASEKTGNNIKDSLNGASGAASLKAWAILAFVLFSAASFKTTQSLAAAFAWLILVAVVLVNGEQLLKMVNTTAPSASRGQTNTQGK